MKKPPSKDAHNWPQCFFKTALSCPYGQKLKIHIGNWAQAPSVISTLWCTQLASEMMILHFFSSSHWRLFRVDEVIKYYYYHLPNFFRSSQKRLWFLVFKDENYLIIKVFKNQNILQFHENYYWKTDVLLLLNNGWFNFSRCMATFGTWKKFALAKIRISQKLH